MVLGVHSPSEVKPNASPGHSRSSGVEGPPRSTPPRSWWPSWSHGGHLGRHFVTSFTPNRPVYYLEVSFSISCQHLLTEDHMLDWQLCQICYPLEIKLPYYYYTQKKKLSQYFCFLTKSTILKISFANSLHELYYRNFTCTCLLCHK